MMWLEAYTTGPAVAGQMAKLQAQGNALGDARRRVFMDRRHRPFTRRLEACAPGTTPLNSLGLGDAPVEL